MPAACFRSETLASSMDTATRSPDCNFSCSEECRSWPIREDDPAVAATKTGSRLVARFRLFPHNQRIDGNGFPGVHDDRIDIHLGNMVLQGDRQMGQFHNAADQS